MSTHSFKTIIAGLSVILAGIILGLTYQYIVLHPQLSPEETPTRPRLTTEQEAEITKSFKATPLPLTAAQKREIQETMTASKKPLTPEQEAIILESFK